MLTRSSRSIDETITIWSILPRTWLFFRLYSGANVHRRYLTKKKDSYWHYRTAFLFDKRLERKKKLKLLYNSFVIIIPCKTPFDPLSFCCRRRRGTIIITFCLVVLFLCAFSSTRLLFCNFSGFLSIFTQATIDKLVEFFTQ